MDLICSDEMMFEDLFVHVCNMHTHTHTLMHARMHTLTACQEIFIPTPTSNGKYHTVQ